MTDIEKGHLNLAIANNNTFRRFILKFGDKKVEEISSPRPSASSQKVFRGQEKDRYVIDPMDSKGAPIDMGHFFAAAQVPNGLGNLAGILVEIDQLRRGLPSAFQGEDLKSNYLGTIFGQNYLNDPKAGKTLREKLANFLKDYENGTGVFRETDVQIWGKTQTNDEGKMSSNNLNEERLALKAESQRLNSFSTTNPKTVQSSEKPTAIDGNKLISSETQVSNVQETSPNADVSKIVALLRNNAAEVESHYGLDVTKAEGLGEAVMQYWKENNLDPKTLKEQLPDVKESEFNTAFANANNKETTKTKDASQQR